MKGIILASLMSTSPEQMVCLAKNIYFEARNQPYIGQLAVAEVVLNRVEDPRYPETICGVVHQGYIKGRRDCQFSWFCDGLSDNPYNENLWEQSISTAYDAIDYRVLGIEVAGGATHYHSKDVWPSWRTSLTPVVRIDDHIFYRWEM